MDHSHDDEGAEDDRGTLDMSSNKRYMRGPTLGSGHPAERLLTSIEWEPGECPCCLFPFWGLKDLPARCVVLQKLHGDNMRFETHVSEADGVGEAGEATISIHAAHGSARFRVKEFVVIEGTRTLLSEFCAGCHLLRECGRHLINAYGLFHTQSLPYTVIPLTLHWREPRVTLDFETPIQYPGGSWGHEETQSLDVFATSGQSVCFVLCLRCNVNSVYSAFA